MARTRDQTGRKNGTNVGRYGWTSFANLRFTNDPKILSRRNPIPPNEARNSERPTPVQEISFFLRLRGTDPSFFVESGDSSQLRGFRKRKGLERKKTLIFFFNAKNSVRSEISCRFRFEELISFYGTNRRVPRIDFLLSGMFAVDL